MGNRNFIVALTSEDVISINGGNVCGPMGPHRLTHAEQLQYEKAIDSVGSYIYGVVRGFLNI